MTDRLPVDITISTEPVEHGFYQLYGPNGNRICWLRADRLEEHGIPVPRPPRVGPEGASEERTREIAGWPDYFIVGRDGDRIARAFCRKYVARWDAEDEARR